jgi:hypothetical protein
VEAGMVFENKKRFLKLMMVVYMIFSLPAVFYAGYKTIKKVAHIIDPKPVDTSHVNDDFYLENEINGGGGG